MAARKPLRLGPDGKLLLSEAEITQQCIQYLKSKGFLCLRLQSGLVRGFVGKSIIRLGEKGICDWVCVRGNPMAVLFLEMKRSKGGRLTPDQSLWQVNVRRSGLPCWVVSSFDDFRKQYIAAFENGICGDPTIPMDQW